MGGKIITVKLCCRPRIDGAVRVSACELRHDGVLHRITPDRPPVLAHPGRAAAQRTGAGLVALDGGTTLAGVPVGGLAWRQGATPWLQFRVGADDLDTLLTHHFGLLPAGGPATRFRALRAYETAILPTANIVAGWRHAAAGTPMPEALRLRTQALLDRILAMKALLAKAAPGHAAMPWDFPAAGGAATGTLRGAGQTGSMIAHLYRRDPESPFLLNSVSLRRDGARHTLLFLRRRSVENSLGGQLGGLLTTLLSQQQMPGAVQDVPEFEYWEPGFLASGAQLQLIASGMGQAGPDPACRAVRVQLNRTNGLPRHLQRTVPWPDPLCETSTASAACLQVQVSLALEAAANLLRTMLSDRRTALDGAWLTHQQDYLWLLANMIGRTFDPGDTMTTLRSDRRHG